MKKELTSVYPCTTVAAMTSYRSGISPNEHGWLGWTLYFKETNRIVDKNCFRLILLFIML